VLHGLLDRLPVALVGELGGVDPDDLEALGGVAAQGSPDPGERALAVDSAERPDIDEDHTALERFPRLGLADPSVRSGREGRSVLRRRGAGRSGENKSEKSGGKERPRTLHQGTSSPRLL
jgi:hypothetical protein